MMSLLESFVSITLTLLVVCDATAGQNAYNFTCNLSPEQHDRILQQAINQLQKDKYTVVEGVMKFILPTNGRFGANPTSPYGIYMFEEEVWKLDEKEAVVFFGCTPPPAKYFSFRSYIFSAFHNLRPTILFASLGDSTNHLVINTTGLTSNDPFGKSTVVISTADMTTDGAVRDAFKAAGHPATAMNTDIIPSSRVKMGHEAFSDTFAMLYRAAIFEDSTMGKAYINTTWPVLKVTPPAQQNALPFATPSLRKRGTGTTEVSYNSSFLNFVAQVEKMIKSNSSYSVTCDKMSVVHLEGWECIKDYTDCLGDNRDASYMNNSKYYKLAEDDSSFFIVCGLNHVKTGKSTYINFAVGSVVAVDDSKFGESSKKYAPNMENIDMFYAYKVARKCNGEKFCLDVPLDKIDADKAFNFVARAYLEPPTKVGPNGSELLMPYVLYVSTNSN